MPENPENNNTSGSIVTELGLPTPNDYSLKGESRVIAVLARKIDDLSNEIYEMKKETLLKETRLPPELLEQLGLPEPPPPKVKRGRGYKPILEHEIIEAKNALKLKRVEINEAMVARYLGTTYITYKKYAKLYGIWNPKPNVRGVPNLFDPERGPHPLSEILEGKHPDYPIFRLKDKLIRSGLKEQKCEICGFKEKRIVDGKTPLVLNFMDGNEKNHRIENIKLYCYNCTFTCGRGYLRKGTFQFDPDWLQDADPDEATMRGKYEKQRDMYKHE